MNTSSLVTNSALEYLLDDQMKELVLLKNALILL